MQRQEWLHYTLIVSKVFIAFSIATFCIGIYFTHLHGAALFITILMVGLYLTVIVSSILQIARSLPFAVVMLLIPIAPLFVLLLILSFLPIWQQML